MNKLPHPAVMVMSGSDPTGGAGIQADIEAIASMGAHAAPVITAVTVQDTINVLAIAPQEEELVIQQARAILEDMPIAAIKLGFLGSTEVVRAIHVILTDYPHIPVVLDPVIKAGGGELLCDEEMISAIQTLILPLTTILTPNSEEAQILAPDADTLDACAMSMLEKGTEFVLITGTHNNTKKVVNILYENNRKLDSFHWERLPHSYHGSGCTLAAAISGLLAHGREPISAIIKAQEYTWQSLKHGYRLGMGQYLPHRLFWSDQHQS